MTGGKMGKAGGGGMAGPGGMNMMGAMSGAGIDTAKMKELEEQLEQEKMAIMKDFERQKAKISAKGEIAEEERNRLLKELE